MLNVNHQRLLAYPSGRQLLKVRLVKSPTRPILVNLGNGHKNLRLSTSIIPTSTISTMQMVITMLCPVQVPGQLNLSNRLNRNNHPHNKTPCFHMLNRPPLNPLNLLPNLLLNNMLNLTFLSFPSTHRLDRPYDLHLAAITMKS